MGALKRDASLAVGAVLGVCAVLFWPLLVGALTGEPRWFEWDVPEQYWPDLVYLCDALHEGTLPLWNPYDRAGYPYYADPQAGTYHPLNWAICGLAGSSPSPAWADARVVIGFALAGLFGLGWLRELRCSWSAAVLGATILMAAPFMRHNWELNLTAGFAWCGAMLWASERIVQRREPLDGLWLALAVGGCAWVGSPPALWQASTFTLLYAVARVASERPQLRPLAMALGLAGLASIGLIGVVIVPGMTLSEHSVQAGRSLASIAEGALPSEYVSAIWAPRDGNHLHVGWIAMLLGGVAVWRRRPSAGAMWCIAIVAVGLSFGGVLFRWAFEYAPGVSIFRLPHRYEAWLGPAFAFLAARGIDAMPQLRVPTRGAVVLGLVAGVSLSAFEPRGLPAVALGVAAVAVLRRFDAPWLGIALSALVLLEVTVAMPPERHLRTGPRPGLDASALIGATRVDWRYMDEFAVGCRSGTRMRHRELRGYQDPLTLRRFSRFVESLREHPELAMQLNVRWALQGPHFIHGWDRHFLPPPSELAQLPETHHVRDTHPPARDTHQPPRRDTHAHEPRGDTHEPPRRDTHEPRGDTHELRAALPFAYWVPWESVEEVVDEDRAMEQLKRVAPARVALLEELEGVMGVHGRPGVLFDEVDAYDVALERDALSFRIDVPSRGVVVVNEAWYPGWRAGVDGAIAPVFRANLLVRAVPVEAGSHRVEMRFEPPDRRWRTAWWLTQVVIFVAFVLRRRRRRRGLGSNPADPGDPGTPISASPGTPISASPGTISST